MSNVAAFFDIDHTILEVNSGSKWISYQWRTGKMSFWQLIRSLVWLVQYRFGWLDFDAMATRALQQYKGEPVEPVYEEVSKWFAADVAWAICTQARERIEHHRSQGHTIVILSSATQFLCHPVVETLKIEHVLCTRVEVEHGKLTGRHIAPACYGQGKVIKAELFAQEHDIDLERSFFYTDSVSDLPMLDRVGEPRVVNPDPRLRRVAAARGWDFETWTAPPRAVQS